MKQKLNLIILLYTETNLNFLKSEMVAETNLNFLKSEMVAASSFWKVIYIIVGL